MYYNACWCLRPFLGQLGPTDSKPAINLQCNAGAGVFSAVWPGTGTLLGYNMADLAITFMLVNPLVDTYFGGLPPPAAMDAGARTGGPLLFQHADEQALRGDAHVNCMKRCMHTIPVFDGF